MQDHVYVPRNDNTFEEGSSQTVNPATKVDRYLTQRCVLDDLLVFQEMKQLEEEMKDFLFP